MLHIQKGRKERVHSVFVTLPIIMNFWNFEDIYLLIVESLAIVWNFVICVTKTRELFYSLTKYSIRLQLYVFVQACVNVTSSSEIHEIGINKVVIFV